MIQVCIPAKGLDSLHEKYITLKELMPIKEFYKSCPSDHYILTPRTIKRIGLNIIGSTNEAYMQAKV